MPDHPDISVIVCTRNRAASIANMLESFCELDIPQGLTWEIVIVDNGSTDQTRDTVGAFSDRLPIVYACEEQAGLSNARNKGVETARGRHIIWTDDDVRVHRDWIATYSKAFATFPQAVFFGGRVVPVLQGQTPQWLKDNRALVSNLMAERDFGDDARLFARTAEEVPFGANFAIRSDEQKAYRFNPKLGVSPRFKRLGEETALFRKLQNEAKLGAWVPGAVVDHLIPESRQTLEYLVVYQKSSGETWAALNDLDEVPFMGQPLEESGKQFMGAPLWLWRKSFVPLFKFAVLRWVSNPRRWIPYLQEYGYYRGALDFVRRKSRGLEV